MGGRGVQCLLTTYRAGKHIFIKRDEYGIRKIRRGNPCMRIKWTSEMESDLVRLRQKSVTWTKLPEEMKKLYEENRSEEHTSELQSRGQLVCRLLLDKEKIR